MATLLAILLVFVALVFLFISIDASRPPRK